MNTPITVDPSDTLADLSVRHAGASRVFHRHGLDFCCHGQVALTEACAKAGIDPQKLAAELQEEIAKTPQDALVAEAALPELVKHILVNFHDNHRAEVPRLVQMARKVESVHSDKPNCPTGLTAHLEYMARELEMHMQKEEQILFPLIIAGRGAHAGMPIAVMEEEHQDHGKNLEQLRELADNYEPPAEACNTWRALYLGLAELEAALMEHIHLENNALFPRALKG